SAALSFAAVRGAWHAFMVGAMLSLVPRREGTRSTTPRKHANNPQIAGAEDRHIVRLARSPRGGFRERLVLGAIDRKSCKVLGLMWGERVALQSAFGDVPTRGRGDATIEELLVGDRFS